MKFIKEKNLNESRIKNIMQKIIGNIKELMAVIPKNTVDENKGKIETLKEYIRQGGIIRIIISKDSFPVIIYPTKIRLGSMIKEKEQIVNEIQKKRNEWNARLNKAKNYHIVNSLKKFSNKTYWKHLAKAITDSGYRSDVKAVKLPLHLVSDERWEPMVRTFVEDDEYRRQMVETVENSLVYKKNKKLGGHAEKINESRGQEAQKNLDEVDKKLNALKNELNVMREMNGIIK